MSETMFRKHSASSPFTLFHDLIAWKRTKEHLQFQSTILQNVSESIIITDLQGNIIYWNEGATALFGYSSQEMLGKTPFILYPESDPHQLQIDLEHIRAGKDYMDEWKGQRKDGTAIWVDIKTSLLRTSEGAAIGFIGVAKDITERKQIEAQLRQSRDQLHIIFQHVADGITVQDRSGALVYINDAGAKLSGFACSQAMLAIDVETLRASYVERFEMKDEFGQSISFTDLPAMKALQGQSYAEALVNYVDRHTGRSLWSVVKASPIFDEHGHVQFAVNIFSDLTARMELEQRKDEFIGMASHELRTPITVLKGLAQLLKRKLEQQELTEPVLTLSKMETQIDRLTRLVNDLLDVTKIQTGQLDSTEERIAVDALISDIVETMQQMSTTHTLTIQGVSGSDIRGDRDRLEQVFFNLKSNAIKYSPSATNVDIHVTSPKDRVIVSVHDYGVGIPQAYQDKLFDRFFRVSDDKYKAFPGLGMGLYIAREIVKRHNGKIWVESAEGKGSTFFVSLPIAD